jgi:hypothetical protein
MKTISSTVWCTVLMFMMFMFFGPATASALDSKQPDVISSGTGTGKASGEIQLMLKVPADSPLFSRFPIAMVNDEVITIDELTKALASSHESRHEEGVHAGKIDLMSMLDRIINMRLIIQEAANMGLDELPDFKSQEQGNADRTLTALVMKDISKDVTIDPLDVEKRFKELVVEWKIKSILFDKEDDAKAMSAAIKAGKSFDELAKAARNDKKATGGEQGEYLKPKDLMPQLAAGISTMQTGSVSPVVKVKIGIKTGFTIIQLEDKRYPENPAARQRAAQIARTDTINGMLAEYKKKIYKEQVTVNEKLLNKLDYDSPKADFQKLLSDARVLVEFKDGKTITVGALTKALQDKFFHGLEQAAKDKLVNKAKREVLDRTIVGQLIRNEGLRRGIEKSDEYKDSIREFKFETLFALFIERAVVPDVKITDDEMRSYYKAHKGEYTDPEMLKMVILDFANKRYAEAALAKLKKGDDIDWVRANAEGLVAPTDEEERGATAGAVVLTTKSLPENMAKTVSGARSGDFKLSAGPEGRFSVLSIQEVIPARQQPFEEARQEIQKKVFEATLDKAMKEWTRKLRAAADVKIYLSGMGK